MSMKPFYSKVHNYVNTFNEKSRLPVYIGLQGLYNIRNADGLWEGCRKCYSLEMSCVMKWNVCVKGIGALENTPIEIEELQRGIYRVSRRKRNIPLCFVPTYSVPPLIAREVTVYGILGLTEGDRNAMLR